MNLVNIFSILAVAKAARLGQDPGFNGGVPNEDPEFTGPCEDSAPFPGSGEVYPAATTLVLVKNSMALVKNIQ